MYSYHIAPVLGRALEAKKRTNDARIAAGEITMIAQNWGEIRRFLDGSPFESSINSIVFEDHYVKALNLLLRLKPVKRRILSYDGELTREMREHHLGAANVRKARRKALGDAIEAASNVLIDLPDYSKTDSRSMFRDLEAVQSLWREACDRSAKANFVIFMQKEMFRDHFFLGKMEVVELESFEPAELVNAYTELHGSAFPFTKDSLLLLARMSRGIFRRFLKYIRLALDDYKRGAIGEEQVRRSVTKHMVSDQEGELAEIFPKSMAPRVQAIEVMNYLEAHDAVSQKMLASALGIEEYALSRILEKLELHGRLIRERKGLTNVVRLRTKSS